jgi:hypothetical protein
MGRVGSYVLTLRTPVFGNSREPLSLSVKKRLQNRVPPNPSLARIGEQIVLMEQRVAHLAEVRVNRPNSTSRRKKFSGSIAREDTEGTFDVD